MRTDGRRHWRSTRQRCGRSSPESANAPPTARALGIGQGWESVRSWPRTRLPKRDSWRRLLMREAQLVPAPVFPPGTCFGCGGNEGPMVDTMVDVVGEGRIYV